MQTRSCEIDTKTSLLVNKFPKLSAVDTSLLRESKIQLANMPFQNTSHETHLTLARKSHVSYCVFSYCYILVARVIP